MITRFSPAYVRPFCLPRLSSHNFRMAPTYSGGVWIETAMIGSSLLKVTDPGDADGWLNGTILVAHKRTDGAHVISQIAPSGGGGDIPADQFSLNFAKIEYSFATQKPDGTIGETINAGFDLKQNKKA